MLSRKLLVLPFVCGLPAPLAFAGSDWKDALKDSLEAAYPVTKRATLSPDRITKQGVVLLIKKEGITADRASDLRYSVTNVKDGQLAEQGGAVSALFTKEKSRVFKAGERAFVIDIKVGDDNVMLLILSAETFDITEKGSTKPTRYKAAVKVAFDKAFLQTADAAAVKAAIDPVLQPEGEAAAASTKTIALGQTREQVEAILGKPERIVDLGAKVTYVYKDMKVIFVDGKVSDVQ